MPNTTYTLQIGATSLNTIGIGATNAEKEADFKEKLNKAQRETSETTEAPAEGSLHYSLVTNAAHCTPIFGNVGEEQLNLLKAALAAGGVAKACVVHFFVRQPGVSGETLIYGFATLGAIKSQTKTWTSVKGDAKWLPVAASTAEAEAITAANVGEIAGFVEKKSAKETGLYDIYLSVEVEESEAGKKVSGAVTGGASTAASSRRISQPSAAGASGLTSHVRTAATVSRRAATVAAASTGATVSVGAVVKTERGPVAAKTSAGANVAATVARKAVTAAASSAGASVHAEALRRAQTVAQASSGASVAARAQRTAQTLPRVSAGAVVTATVRRVARVGAVVTSSASTRATVAAHTPLRANLSSGVSITANVVRVGQSVEPPTSTPVAGHVAIGQRGRIGVHRGRIPTRNVGRAER